MEGSIKWSMVSFDQNTFFFFFFSFASVQFSRSVVSDSLWPHGLQHARLPCPSPTPGACSNSCPLSWWCHPTISSSAIPFSSCLQFFPASKESFLCTRWPKYWSFSFICLFITKELSFSLHYWSLQIGTYPLIFNSYCKIPHNVIMELYIKPMLQWNIES